MNRYAVTTILSGALLGFGLLGCEQEGYEEAELEDNVVEETYEDNITEPFDEDQTVIEDPEDRRAVVPPPIRDEQQLGEQEMTLVGVLEGEQAGIGGEHTGWVLSGTAEGDIEVDISNVADQAQQFEGSQVVITGAIIEKDYLERGPTMVLVAERIEGA